MEDAFSVPFILSCRFLITSLILEKCKKNNAIFFKLFWYKAFVHWKLKLLNFLVDSVLIFCILYFSQETLVCYHNPCHHGGTCVENPLAPCVCPNGYIGPHCEGNILGQILLWSNTKHPRVNKILYPIHLCDLTGTYTYKTVESRLSGFVGTWANSLDKGKYEYQ